MAEKKSETHVKSAGILDTVVGNAGENGELMENGHPVTETVVTEDDSDEKDKDK